MIPQLQDGVLPPGVFPCTIDEVEEVFGRGSGERAALVQRLRAFLDEVRQTGFVVALVLDGSFVTSKQRPGDIDLILALRPGIAPEDAAEQVEIAAAARPRFGFDVFALEDRGEAYESIVEFLGFVRDDDWGSPRVGKKRVC